jgi:hypothetical protein
MKTTEWFGGLGAACLLTACVSQEPFVEGTVRVGEDLQLAEGQHLIVRAVPDHPDGFDPRRVYHGDEVFAEQAEADAVQFPYEFHIEGSEPRSQDIPWLLLAWISDDPRATWIQPGERFGATQFDMVHVSHGPLFANGLEVTIDGVAPPE